MDTMNIADVLKWATTLPDNALNALAESLASMRRERLTNQLSVYPPLTSAERDNMHGNLVNAVKSYKDRTGLPLYHAHIIVTAHRDKTGHDAYRVSRMVRKEAK